eukprot:GHVP01036780.1.p2 GENE.GHVP01036780.1~~GHVP01036780.1.p2  ORF type:complete len:112 (+),score=5.82 GHVP01036780.1:779-1114(+)
MIVSFTGLLYTVLRVFLPEGVHSVDYCYCAESDIVLSSASPPEIVDNVDIATNTTTSKNVKVHTRIELCGKCVTFVITFSTSPPCCPHLLWNGSRKPRSHPHVSINLRRIF